MKQSLKFRIGITLLLINYPVGWGGVSLCSTLAILNDNAKLHFVGIGIYTLSWLMLGLGLLLAGPEGIQYSRILLKRFRDFLFS